MSTLYHKNHSMSTARLARYLLTKRGDQDRMGIEPLENPLFFFSSQLWGLKNLSAIFLKVYQWPKHLSKPKRR
uniref:Uncharacterized protein n=1 Tax=uncultured Parcubacteria bacterium Rifle_16ft_4_minimus_2958 TaxID=1665137 RepID=A0A0H4T5Y0_9BACT|nr:hypothetical protein [uncultured Parcubacteria bacterium Rifle_16ft_4_minimus_2958]